ncbi:MAG: response regulator [Candidatus Omnitrophica bacterium]|nr:response regulator [Candidatus Omnitrophota bacterium]
MPKKILIVDDNPGDLFLMTVALDESGVAYELASALSGEEAIKKAEDFRPELAIVDTRLPKIDGYETCKKLKEKFGASCKVVIITGLIDAVDSIKARISACDAYCVKTLDRKDLIETVKRLSL